MDDPDGGLYVAFIASDKKVWTTSSRYAHSSASRSTTWSSFLAEDLIKLVRRTMGQNVLEEMLECLKQQNIK